MWYPPTPPLQGERAKGVSEVRFHLSIFPWSSFIFFSESEVRQFFWRKIAFFGPWSWWLHHLLFVFALHHLSVSLGRQNATLESFTGDGFGRFGLESCWSFPVSHACPTEPFDEELASAWGLNPRVLRALILVVASSFVCGCIASSFCFFRPSERNVRQFYGGWFCRFGLESCWGFPVSHACPTEPFDEELASAWGLKSSRSSGLDLGGCLILCLWLHCIIFLFPLGRQNATLAVLRGMVLAGLGLESCWGFPVSHACPTEPFDEELASAWGLNPRVLRALILVVASSFVCGCIASSFCFFRPSERNVGQFYGGWFWQVWAWILLGVPCFACMPHRALWRGIGFRLRLESSRSSGPWSWWLPHLLFVVALHHLPVSLGRQNATLKSFTGDGFGRFGLESCWGFLVSHACPTEPFDEELASAWGLKSSRSSVLDLGGCLIFCLWLHCIIFLFL